MRPMISKSGWSGSGYDWGYEMMSHVSLFKLGYRNIGVSYFLLYAFLTYRIVIQACAKAPLPPPSPERMEAGPQIMGGGQTSSGERGLGELKQGGLVLREGVGVVAVQSKGETALEPAAGRWGGRGLR